MKKKTEKTIKMFKKNVKYNLRKRKLKSKKSHSLQPFILKVLQENLFKTSFVIKMKAHIHIP